MTLEVKDIFSVENKYRKSIEKNSNNGFEKEKIVIGVHKRVSTDKQFQDGDSLEMQQELANKHANEIGGVIYKYYEENGLSAKKNPLDKRPVMQEIIQDIEDGKINYLIAYRRDRLFRNQAENMWFWSLLAEHDCKIFLTASGETQVNIEEIKKAGTTKMMESILAMLAEMESEITSTRVSDTMISKAKKGEYTGGATPIGYERIEGRFTPKNGVKELFYIVEDLYLQGFGLLSIAKWLNGEKVSDLPQLESSIKKPIDSHKDTLWNHRNINTILFNPFYTGHVSYQSKKNIEMNRIIKEVDYIEPIRTLERQKQINAFKKKKEDGKKAPRAYNTSFLLTGILYCGECGAKMLGSTTQKKGSEKKYCYYSCPTKKSYYGGVKKCENVHYNKDALEAVVIKATKEKTKFIMSDDFYKKASKKIKDDKKTYASQYDLISEEVTKKEKELSRLIKMTTQIEDVELQKVYFAEQSQLITKINEMKDSMLLVAEKANGEVSDDFNFESFIELSKDYSKMIGVAPIGIQKQLIENLFADIRIDKNGEVSMQWNIGLVELLAPVKEVDDSNNTDEVMFYTTVGSPPVILSVFK
ncbi:hypothetical protein ABD91_01330 [Lysinibacillus sphaericus]|uniref:recombinase family protein n=1 Tax=Lysinibacillus sphaericus TaxID=1421 RepID=UPI0018CFAA43|nr:recombinase family protein [Lysinibacillus sphaericus]MBG9689569.1 hypothetical protein [Lysinibacillus sphaericus]